MSPAETILANLPAVRAAFALHPGPSAAWRHLQATCPSLTTAVPLNTFRTVAPVVLATVDAVAQTCVTVPRPASVAPPKTFEGWSVQTDKDGYTRLHKKHGGRVLSVYIGRVWDAEKARERIEALALASG